MKKFTRFLMICAAGAVCAIAFTGCSSYALVNSQTYVNADLNSYHTFKIINPHEAPLPPGMTLVTYYNIAAAIREQMVERGFVEDENSNLLINIAVTEHTEVATGPALPPPTPPVAPPIPPRFGPGPHPGPIFNGMAPYYMYPPTLYYPNQQVVTGIYKEGVLTMDLVNVASNTPLFTASVAAIMQGNTIPQFQNLEGIAKAVKTLFSQFPVPVEPQYRNYK